MTGVQAKLLDTVRANGSRDEALTLSRVNGVLQSDYVRLFRATEGCVSCHNPQGSAGAFSLHEVVGAAFVRSRGVGGELRKMMFMNRIWTVMACVIGLHRRRRGVLLDHAAGDSAADSPVAGLGQQRGRGDSGRPQLHRHRRRIREARPGVQPHARPPPGGPGGPARGQPPARRQDHRAVREQPRAVQGQQAQERVSGEYVPRVPHAPERDPGLRPGAPREARPAQAGEGTALRREHHHQRQSPADHDQRSARSGQDAGGQDGAARRAGVGLADLRVLRLVVLPAGAEEEDQDLPGGRPRPCL